MGKRACIISGTPCAVARKTHQYAFGTFTAMLANHCTRHLDLCVCFRCKAFFLQIRRTPYRHSRQTHGRRECLHPDRERSRCQRFMTSSEVRRDRNDATTRRVGHLHRLLFVCCKDHLRAIALEDLVAQSADQSPKRRAEEEQHGLVVTHGRRTARHFVDVDVGRIAIGRRVWLALKDEREWFRCRGDAGDQSNTIQWHNIDRLTRNASRLPLLLPHPSPSPP
jgi:hypothetical protein